MAYRDPESQAFIESWFGKLNERCVWRHEFETLEQAREVIDAYVIHYHHRPDYRTPLEVAATGTMEDTPTESQRPDLTTRPGSTSGRARVRRPGRAPDQRLIMDRLEPVRHFGSSVGLTD